MLDSNFYPGFFDAQAKLDVARGPLAFIIKNYIARCNNVPKLIGYISQSHSNSHYAYFATEAGLYLGTAQYEHGYDPKYSLWNTTVSVGSIDGSNIGQFSVSTKSSYIVSSITKQRVSGNNPAKQADLIPKHWFGNMMVNVLYKHERKMRKLPEPPRDMSIKDMEHVTPILLEGASPLTLPDAIRQKVENIHKYINKRSDTHMEWDQHVREMFGREKWLILPRRYIDNTRVYTVGAFRFPDEPMGKWIKTPSLYSEAVNSFEITQPFFTYRTLEDLPDDLQGLMTMQQHMLKTSHMNYVSGTNNMVPYTGSTDSVIWPEMNSGVYDVASDTVAYILDK